MRRGGMLQSEGGFTLIELIIILVILGLLAAVAIPRYVDLRTQALKSSAKATLDAGRAAVTLDFASKIVNGGTYTSPLTTAGDLATLVLAAPLEALLEGRPNYPGAGGASPGAYCTAVATTADCFHWYVVDVGSSTSPIRPARISATLGNGATAVDVNTL